MAMTLLDAYRSYNERDIYPFHMPGHKRNTELMQMDNPYGIDYTEIDDLDDLHEASANPERDTIIAASMRRAAELFKVKRSVYLIGGSTAGNVASILGLTRRGDHVLVPRNCHKSVYNALSLAGVRPVYVAPAIDEEMGIYGVIEPSAVEEAFRQYPDIKLVFLVSPTFYGVVSDVRSIAEIAHRHGAVLVVDEAHGPHLGLSPYFPDSSIHQGADVCTQSLHKTLPVLTQTSILHVNSDRVDPENITRTLAIIESTSPSYVLMASADQCIDLLERRGEELFEIYHKRLVEFSEKMKQLKHLTVLCKGNDSFENHPEFFDFDEGKIMISCRRTTITGSQLYGILLKKYRLQMEMKLNDFVLAMTSIADTQRGFDRLADALLEIDQSIDDAPLKPLPSAGHEIISVPELAPFEATELYGEFVPPEESVGRIAREFVYSYPPGIPYILPGERITQETLDKLNAIEATGINLIGTRHRYPHAIEVCIEK